MIYGRSSLHQVSACTFYKNIFQSCFTKGTLPVQRGQKSNSISSAVKIVAFGTFGSFLVNGIFTQTFDQTGGRVDLFQLAVRYLYYPAEYLSNQFAFF